ncbi:glycosyltransferase family 2 protein [Aeromonas caviae]|uniref:glycosyltransferase family 2 protein n=1 Tax=Aeromonas caviae TaxID=648 RepID=UPI003EC78205
MTWLSLKPNATLSLPTAWSKISMISQKNCIPAICLGVIELVNIKMSNSISVVIPYFNDSPVIERCLNSVFKQTHRPNQIIIVDDCSDDSSVLRDIVANMPSGIEIIAS